MGELDSNEMEIKLYHFNDAYAEKSSIYIYP